MKKKHLKIFLVLLIIIGISVSVSTVKLESWNIKIGELDHDDSGKVTGCSGTGNECMIVY
ncbi:MAG: hypothetical protein KAW12_02530 [Candidatus Aminicenantes bacterium]|nr:hypothetical protein [Candidatus Aminicenantes bacterium]